MLLYVLGMCFALDKLATRVVEYGTLILNKNLLLGKLRSYGEINTDKMAAESLKKRELPRANAAFKSKNYSNALISYRKIEKLLSPAELRKMVFCEKTLSAIKTAQL